ncbi:MAG TPA: Flp family type IVb pilin [Bryobacteraceae bacterium]|nr:Flp family type IVb pilin [Bryobacteraceae bacterium]
MTTLKNFWKDESGQDLVEYTLLLAFMSLVAAAIMINVSGSVSTVWSVTSTDLSKAAASASS